MKQIAVIGDPSFTLGFRLTGIRKIIEVQDASDAIQKVQTLRKDTGIGIVIIDEQTMKVLDQRTKEESLASLDPVFVTVSSEDSQEELRKMIIQSIGVDLQKEEGM